MAEQQKDLDGMVEQTERLGVVGSPSSTAQLALDILGSAVTRKLVGELLIARWTLFHFWRTSRRTTRGNRPVPYEGNDFFSDSLSPKAGRAYKVVPS